MITLIFLNPALTSSGSIFLRSPTMTKKRLAGQHDLGHGLLNFLGCNPVEIGQEGCKVIGGQVELGDLGERAGDTGGRLELLGIASRLGRARLVDLLGRDRPGSGQRSSAP